MRKRIASRVLVAMLCGSLALGNAAPVTVYAQEAEVAETEVTEAEVTEAEATEAEVTEAEATEAEATEAEVTEAEATEAEATEAEATEAEVTQEQAEPAEYSILMTESGNSGINSSLKQEAIDEETLYEWFSADNSYSLYLQFKEENGKPYAIIKGYGTVATSRDITIPSKVSAGSAYSNYKDYQNVAVKAIDQNAFTLTNCPTSVVIPACVESIGTNAFTSGTSNKNAQLTSVTIEAGSALNYIGDCAFQNQSKLAIDLVIPSGVTYIGFNAFEGCSAITSVTFNGGGVIEEKAFTGCTNAKGGIKLPAGVTEIGKEAFKNFGKNTKEPATLVLPSGLKTIGDSAFESALLKGDITIPASVTYIGKKSFYNAFTQTDAASMGKLTFKGTKFNSIEQQAFYKCAGLTGSLVIPNSVTNIGASAFEGCLNLNGTLTLSSKVDTIGSKAFYGCSKLTGALTIPNTVVSLGTSAFENCSGFNGKLTISSKLTAIPTSAFKACSGLTGSITLPAELKTIGNGAFCGCSKLTGALKIPAKVTKLSDEAFEECSGFTSLSMPDGVTYIGKETFLNCTGFKNEFTLPESLAQVGNSAFEGCSGFKGNLDMPDTVTRIGQYAFAGMSGLNGYMYLSSNLKTFGKYAFLGCANLKNQTDKNGEKINIVVAYGTKMLPEGLFQGCFGLTRIVLPYSVTDINTGVFAQTNSALDVYVYSGSPTAEFIRNLSASDKNFDVVYIDYLYKVELDPPTDQLVVRVGESKKIKANLHYYKYNEVKDTDEEVIISSDDADELIEWEITNSTYATCNNGVLKGLQKGNVSLTVSVPSTIMDNLAVGTTCKVAVVNSLVKSVKFNDTTKVSLDSSKDESQQIELTVTFQGLADAMASKKVTEDDLTISWSQSIEDALTIKTDKIVFSEDYQTATVTATVKAKAGGSVTLRALAQVKGDDSAVTSSNTKRFDTIVPLEKIKLKSTLTGKVGGTYTLTPTYVPAGSSTKKVTWATGDTSVATVSTNGLVTFRGEGTTVITCTPVNNEAIGDKAKPVTCVVTVLPKDSTLPDTDDDNDDNKDDDGDNPSTDAEVAAAPAINVSYRTHVQSFGWQDYVKNGAMSGTSGLAKRLEGINISVTSAESGKNADLGIQYTTHCQSYGWLPWSANGDMNGTEGEAKRLEAIMIQLTGEDADLYDIYYRVHAQSYGWLGWAKNGEPSGTAGYGKRLEGIQIVVVKKGESINEKMGNITSVKSEAYVAASGQSPIVNYPSTSNTDPVIPGEDTPNVAYRTHVQSFGWQGWKYNGQMSGTSGLAKRLEGIELKLTNKDYEGGIVYTTHVQSYGWQGKVDNQSTWKKDGQMSGTSGEAKRLEAICIALTGEMAEHYDVYYRVHAQSFGWLGWAKNGEESGTAGYGKRLEGIQIVLTPKGTAPASNYGGITSVESKPYIQK